MALTDIPPILEEWIAAIRKCMTYLGKLPDVPTGHGGEYTRLREDEAGLELVSSIVTLTRPVIWLTEDTTLDDSYLQFDIVGTTQHDRLLIAQHATPSNNLVLTLPANTAPGKYWYVVQGPDQTGQVRLRPSTGATLQGGTADLRLTGPYAAAEITCIKNDTGAAAQYIVVGSVTSV